MLTTMQDRQLTLQSLFRHGAAVYADSQVSAFDGQRVQSYSYAEIAARVARLANGLQRLGIRAGDRVGTFCWNTPEHLEAYFAVPMMGAVLHTLNVRLFADQLAYIVNHAEDRIIVVDATLAPVLAQAAPEFKSVERYVVVGPSQCGGATLPGECIDYESLLGSEPGDPEWPDLSESAAAVMCYT
ncbi:MAG: long-chain fatty acid--CoA ligase, partial [Terriglobia bacterium]